MMKRRNATRSALFTSIISLLLCVSMLVGTTFAWFTDSVESGRNTIAAGNLDVELYANGNKVDSSTKLFDDVTPDLWEPGAVAYEDLQVKNVGSLALQYSLELDVLEETVVNGYKLSDVIKVGIVDNGVGDATREEAIANVTSWTKLSNFKFNQNGVKLEAGKATDVFGVVLYWMPNDNDVDNHYNMNNENQGNVLSLEIGVTLMATQVQHETDSFGEDYDGEATPWIGAVNTDWYFEDPEATSFTIDTVDELAGLAAIVNGTATAPVTTFAAGSETTVQDSFKGKTITLGADIDLANSSWTPIGNSTNKFQGTFDGGNYTISNLKVTGNGSYVGLFGYTTNGEIKNLTVENAAVSGRVGVGVVAGSPYTSKYNNITVKGHVEVNGLSYVGGVGGRNAYASWDNITVDVDETSYVKANSVENGTAYRTYVGGVIGFMGEGGHKVSNVTSNIDVIGSTCDVGGIVGIAHYGNQFENITCTGDVTITDAAEAADAEEIGGIAGVWHNGGADVTFTNCSFTGKLTANYTDGVDLSDNTITGKAYGTGNGKLIIDGKTTSVVSSAAGLTNALNNAATGESTFILVADITGNVTVTQKEDVKITIDGNGHKFNGIITVDGKSARYETAALTIKNVNFHGQVEGADAYIKLGVYGDDNTRYTNHVTVQDCTFAGTDQKVVAVKSYTGGDWNVTITGCTVDAGMHSLAQLKNVAKNLSVTDCKVYSKNGLNVNNGDNLAMSGCTFDVQGYAVRFGESNNTTDENFTITDSTLKSACAEAGDAVIEFRKGAVNATLTLTNTKLEGTTAFKGNTGDTTIILDGQYWVSTADQLAAVVANGATDIYLLPGEYDVKNCGGKTLTISGSEDAVIKLYNDGENGCDYAFGSAGTGVGTYTFNGVTFDTTGNTGSYKGFAYMKGIFNDCSFVGAYSLNNANDFAFNRCTFDFKDGYFWTWGAETVTFDGCTFNGNSKAILAHGWASTVININNCTFAATEKGYTGSGAHTAAVEIDPAGTNTYTISFTGENTITDSYAGWTRVKDDSTGHTITGLN